MAYNGMKFDMSLVAAVDMSSAQYRLVRIQSGQNGQVAICSIAAEGVDGVLMNKPTSGRAADVVFGGVVKFRAGAAIKGGAFIETNATGYGIAGTASGYIGRCIVGCSSGALGVMIKYIGNPLS